MEALTFFYPVTLGFSPKRLHFLFAVYSATEVTGLARLPSEPFFHLARPPWGSQAQTCHPVGKREKSGTSLPRPPRHWLCWGLPESPGLWVQSQPHCC